MNPSPSACPCQSGATYEECCQPILDNHQNASTPLSLMRSRYTAYTLKNENHLLRTWHPDTRPASISFDESKWVSLAINDSSRIDSGEVEGIVNYSATCINGDRVLSMTEHAIFKMYRGLWMYYDGKVSTIEKKLHAKMLCPCGSNKKYKRCCKQ